MNTKIQRCVEQPGAADNGCGARCRSACSERQRAIGRRRERLNWPASRVSRIPVRALRW